MNMHMRHTLTRSLSILNRNVECSSFILTLNHFPNFLRTQEQILHFFWRQVLESRHDALWNNEDVPWN